MTKTITLTALIVLLGTTSGQAFAYSNVSPREPTKAVSSQTVSNRMDVFDQLRAQQETASDAYRYHGGPKSND